MPTSMLAGVYDGSNQTGSGQLYAVGRSSRYNAVRGANLNGLGLFDRISSATVYSSSTADATLIFFDPSFFISAPLPFLDFTGRFVQLTNRRGAASERDINLSSVGFNNTAGSMMLVPVNKTGEFDVRMSFRDLFFSRWITTIDGLLSGSPARRNGDPLLTWEMFPQGISHLDSTRRYLKIHQRLRIEIDWWPDYDASLTYHVYLYLNNSGQLRGHVARWAYWVEGGIKSGEIASRLEPQVISGANTLTQELTQALIDMDPGIPFSDLYYLPGRQTSTSPNTTLSGYTTDDITIVVSI